MSVRSRQLMLFVLVWVFAAQTWLVYSDPKGSRHTLSEQGVAGQSIWRRENCQSCHQLYGFGGFLGPDLTNAIGGLSAERFRSLLTVGAGQMPAFELPAAEVAALAQYLTEIDRTGVGQLRQADGMRPGDLLATATAAAVEVSESVARGRELVLEQNCVACHLPNEASLHRATDLTLVAAQLSRARVAEVLDDGVPGTAMVALGMGTAEADAVFEFLSWMNAEGASLRTRFRDSATTGELRLSRIPWFEYP